MDDIGQFCRRHGLDADAERELRALAGRGDGATWVDGADGARASAEAPAATRYRAVSRLGEGGSAEVLRVWDASLEREVAMKVLRAERVRGDLPARFVAEARLTAGLQHPGILPVHELGTLPDGRLYFTMEEVRGSTLGAVLASGGRALPSLVRLFLRAAEAVAYAHSRGVVHHDLKPGNILVGDFGEVRVADWGLATRGEPVGVRGTPRYMAPEQAHGSSAGPRTDVWALGAVLYAIVTGADPFAGRGSAEVLDALRAGTRPTDPEASRAGVPSELLAVVRRAMATDPADRYPDAGALAGDVGAWLEGEDRRERALALVGEAVRRRERGRDLRAEADAERGRAAALDRGLSETAPIEDKRPRWAHEDAAARLDAEADVEEARAEAVSIAALSHAPELPAAHAFLAAIYRERHAAAEARGDLASAREAEVHLREHDRGEHGAYLDGAGTLALRAVPRADVGIRRVVERDRRLVLGERCWAGTTPIHALRLPMGSYVVELRAEGHHEARYPVFLDRQRAWDGGEPLRLVPLGGLGPDDVHVPAGPCLVGGESPATHDWIERRRLWVDGFVLRRHPVTNAEYVAFLDALVAAGREGEALRHAPRAGTSGEGPLVYGRDADGRFVLGPDPDGDVREARAPVVQVDWEGAAAYAAWLAARDGLPWRLADEWEWEKAARGADGRLYPWGHHADPTWFHGRPAAGPAPVDAHPVDTSVYGVSGLAGNVQEWCLGVFRPPEVDGRGRLVVPVGEQDAPGRRAVRGGCWVSAPKRVRVDERGGAARDLRSTLVGFRIARSLAGS